MFHGDPVLRKNRAIGPNHRFGAKRKPRRSSKTAPLNLPVFSEHRRPINPTLADVTRTF